jgi:IS5 family transposase
VAITQVAALPRGRKTVGGDKGYDQRPFVKAVRAVGATPHVAAKEACGAIDARTTRHPGYAVSQHRRKRVEEIFGWMKTVGLLRKLRHRGVARVHWTFVFTAAAYNLVRMRTLAARPA